MFVSIPDGGSTYVLSGVINGFDDDRAMATLRNCHRAMTPKAKILLVNIVLPDRAEQSSTAQAAFGNNLRMMVITGGRNRTRDEYRHLCRAAGFEMTNIIPTQSVLSVIECSRA